MDSLKARSISINITATGPRLNGPLHLVTSDDGRQLARYRHALLIAAAGTHPDWWQQVLGREPIGPDVVLPGTYHDPTCATCGQPAPHLDHHLLPWCDTHQEVTA